MNRATVLISGGGDPGTAGRTAIAEAIERVLSQREAGKDLSEPPWALAGRLEAVSSVRVRSWSDLAGH